MPFADEAKAMRIALESVGPHLRSLPDGEIGERTEACPGGSRSAWVQTIMDRCEADSRNWEVSRLTRRNARGYAADYESGPKLKPKHGPRDVVGYLDFGWAEAAKGSYPTFVQLRDEFGLDDLKFQVGLPTGLGSTFAMMAPLNAVRYAGAFSRRMAIEANEIVGFVEPGDLVFQIEVPGELALAYRLPDPLVKLATRPVVSMVRQIDASVPVGVHLCFGDLNNEALIKASSIDKAVAFANALIAAWPSSHHLDYVHFPLAEAADPPRLDRAYYEPLAGLEMSGDTRFVAGFVHPKRTDDELRTILGHIESIRGGPVAVASSCGLGRVDEAAARRAIDAAGALCAPEPE